VERESTAIRLKKIMDERNLRQADVLELAKPYSKELGIKLNRSDLSQYISGKVEPRQHKLTLLANALNVSEVWLMGIGDDRERNLPATHKVVHKITVTEKELEVLKKYRSLDEHGTDIVDTVLDKEYARCEDESKNSVVITKELLEKLPFSRRLELLKYQDEPELKLVARKRKKEKKNV